MDFVTKMALLLINASDFGSGAGPDGPPTNPNEYCYDSNRVGLSWSSGDDTASTQILRDGGGLGKVVYATQEPGIESYETGLETTDYDDYTWTARHIKNGETTSEILFGVPDCSSSNGSTPTIT